MKKIKIELIILTLIVGTGLVVGGLISVKADTPLSGKLIALDAGHGGDEVGAQYPANSGKDAKIYEKDVNLAVVYALKERLENAGVTVVLTRKCNETISSRKSRVDIAIEECKNLYGRKCDVLVSVHHDGSTNPDYDGLMVIYNEKQDIPLATILHDVLWASFSSNTSSTYVDEGLDHGGYGMTVYGHLVSALTEAYYITNDWEAQQYLNGTTTTVCAMDSGNYSVLIGDRVNQEVDALYQGLVNYFSIPPKKPGRK